jgi:hypothetical protein
MIVKRYYVRDAEDEPCEAGVEVEYVHGTQGPWVESTVRLRVDMYGDLVLDCTHGRLVLKPSASNNVIVEVVK